MFDLPPPPLRNAQQLPLLAANAVPGREPLQNYLRPAVLRLHYDAPRSAAARYRGRSRAENPEAVDVGNSRRRRPSDACEAQTALNQRRALA